MARSPIKADVTQPTKEPLDFDEGTLKGEETDVTTIGSLQDKSHA